MITILIVDDLDEKVVEISKIIGKFEVPATVLVASDIINARRNLNENEIDIVVLDLFLPVRFGEQIEDNGGLLLLKEIQKGKFSSIPKIIFGLSVADDFTYDGYWPFFRYDSNNTWIKPFKTAFNHVNLYRNIYNEEAGYTGFQIYLEGRTDYTVFEKCRTIFFADRKDIVLRFESGAGAAWVTRQLLAHCMMLPFYKQNGLPVKCAGIYDNDPAGKKALRRIDNFLSADAAERKHFKSFVVRKNYSPISKCLLTSSEFCVLEDLYCVSIWMWAFNEGLLVRRNEPRELINLSISDILVEVRYLEDVSEAQCKSFLKVYSEYEFPHENKCIAIHYWFSLDEEVIRKTIVPIKFLLQEVIGYYDN